MSKKQPTTELPETPPTILNTEAKRIYKNMLHLFKELGCTAVDINTVVSFCDTVALKEKAMKEIAKNGEIVQNGKIMQASPWLTIRNKAIEQEKKLVQDLGASPAVRARLNIEINKADKTLESIADKLCGEDE